MGSFQAKECVRETNLPFEMEQFAIEVVDNVMQEYKEKCCRRNSHGTGGFIYDDQRICDAINQSFTAKHGGEWSCIAGPHAVYSKIKRPAKFIYFEYETSFTSQKYRIFIFCDDESVSSASVPPPIYQEKVPLPQISD